MDPSTPTPSGKRSSNRTGDNSSIEALLTPPRETRRELSSRVKRRSSPIPRKLSEMQRAASTPPEVTRETVISTQCHGTANELSSITNLERSLERQKLSQKRSQYYSEAFGCREPNNTMKDRVHRDSMVVADVRLNRMVEAITQSKITNILILS